MSEKQSNGVLVNFLESLRASGATLVMLAAGIFGLGAWVQSLASDTASLRMLYNTMYTNGTLVSQDLSKKVLVIDERQKTQMDITLQTQLNNTAEHKSIISSLDEIKKQTYINAAKVEPK